MGCLKRIIKLSIVGLAVVGVLALSKLPFLQDKLHINLFHKPTQEELQKKAENIADFSKINDEYKLTRTANILGFKTVVAEHKGSGQKLIISDEGKKDFLTKKDFANKTVDKKLEQIAEKVQYQMVRVEDLKVTQRGTFQSMGQTVPFVKFSADTVNLPVSSVQGIIGVANDKETGHHLLLISINDGKKYSQIITQEFFKDVK